MSGKQQALRLRQADKALVRLTDEIAERVRSHGGCRVDRAKAGVLRAACWGLFLLRVNERDTARFAHHDRGAGRVWRFDLTVLDSSAVLCGEHQGERTVLAQIALGRVSDGSRVRWRAGDDVLARFPDPGFLP